MYKYAQYILIEQDTKTKDRIITHLTRLQYISETIMRYIADIENVLSVLSTKKPNEFDA